MLFQKQKPDSRRQSRISGQDKYSTIEEYRAMIMPVQFSIKQLEMFGCFSAAQIQNMESTTIDENKLRQLIVDGLKLTFIYIPLRESLQRESSKPQSQFQLKVVLRILFKGEFYRFIHNHQNQLKILINNRTTEANVSILIAGLLIYAVKKFTMEDISTALLFFTLEAALYNSEQLGIPFDTQRIIRILKKIERQIKPLQFKTWVETVKSSKDFKGQIEAHHFLFLCNLTERKFTNGFGSLIFKPKTESLFKNLNLNLKIAEFQQKETTNDGIQQRRIIRGLSFSEPRIARSTFSKEILKQFRLRDPTKHKRPNTALLRRHVSTFIPSISLQKYMTLNAHKMKKVKFHNDNTLKRDSIVTTKISKMGLTSSYKAQFKLKLAKKQCRLKIF